jgi:hypothetical protein
MLTKCSLCGNPVLIDGAVPKGAVAVLCHPCATEVILSAEETEDARHAHMAGLAPHLHNVTSH